MTGKVRLVDVTLTFNTQVFFTNLLVAGGRKPKKKFLRALATEKRIFCADRGFFCGEGDKSDNKKERIKQTKTFSLTLLLYIMFLSCK